MRYGLTLLMVTSLLAGGYGQAPQWLSFVLNGNPPTPAPIRLALDGSLDLNNGVVVDSRFASVSADGRRIVFQVGPKVVTNANGQPQTIPPQIYEMNLSDPIPQARPVQGTFLDANGQPQSVTLSGLHPVISADGQHIAFASSANYGVTTNGRQQIYVLDRAQNRIVPISVLWKDDQPPPPNGDGVRDTYELSKGNCIPVYISADGRIVVFLAESPQSLNIVDADGNGVADTVNNPPAGWVVLVHDRDADGNGIYDEAGIGATSTRIVSYEWQNYQQVTEFVVGSAHVSANGRFITYAYQQNQNEPWRVVVRDIQTGDVLAELIDAFAPSLSDDGTYLAYLQPTNALNENPAPPYSRALMDLVVRQVIDPQTGQPPNRLRELRLSLLLLAFNQNTQKLDPQNRIPSQPGAMGGAAGYGYSDWWGAVAVAVDPNDSNVVYVAFHSWDTDLIDLNLVQLKAYFGVPNIFVARFDFSNWIDDNSLYDPNRVRLWRVNEWTDQQNLNKRRGLPVSLDTNPPPLPLGANLLPTVSFVDPTNRQLVIVFQSLARFDDADNNGLWDIYSVRVRLP